MSTRSLTLIARTLFVLALSFAFSITANAQGRGHHGPPGGMPPGQAKKVVTMDHASDVTRQVLVAHGYTVVKIEIVKGTRVVYYRRGNRGHGRGLGPVERMVIRPDAERVVFEAAPKSVLVDIHIKLGS
ncbi:MAG TPA: hypothetical protein VFW89_02940 [Gemmatimonadaceae bacterium]|nr:hypothetical protein [Gemmatimonadaceae bacterium]